MKVFQRKNQEPNPYSPLSMVQPANIEYGPQSIGSFRSSINLSDFEIELEIEDSQMTLPTSNLPSPKKHQNITPDTIYHRPALTTSERRAQAKEWLQTQKSLNALRHHSPQGIQSQTDLCWLDWDDNTRSYCCAYNQKKRPTKLIFMLSQKNWGFLLN